MKITLLWLLFIAGLIAAGCAQVAELLQGEDVSCSLRDNTTLRHQGVRGDVYVLTTRDLQTPYPLCTGAAAALGATIRRQVDLSAAECSRTRTGRVLATVWADSSRLTGASLRINEDHVARFCGALQ